MSASGAPLRVVFMGTPQFAVPTLRALIASRHTVVGVITQPDRPRGRGQQVTFSPVKQLALEHGVPVFQPDRLRPPEVEQTLRDWAPDLGVVAAYGKIIPESLLAVPRFGMINVHASLLPRWRGAAPVHRSVIEGDAETGVTIMRVVKALDAGDMFATVTRPIGPDDTSDVVERDLSELGAQLLVEITDRIAAGTATETPQDETLVTYAARLTKEEGALDWSLPAAAVHNRVRGLYPWPHAYSWLDGQRIILLRTTVLASASDAPAPAGAGPDAAPEPGIVLESSSKGIVVATGHGGRVAVIELQAEGKKPMTAQQFLAGRPVKAGARFSPPPARPADPPAQS